MPIQSEDTLPSIFTAVAISKERTLYLDSYYDMLVDSYPQPDDKQQELGLTPFYLKKALDNQSGQTHYLSAFPITPAITALPVFMPPLLLGMPVSWHNLYVLSHLSSALTMAAAGVVFLYLIERYYLPGMRKKAVFLTFIYLFCTINFAVVSQAMWQFGTLQLFSLLALLFFNRALEIEAPNLSAKGASSYFFNIFMSGMFFGLAFITRPTAVLPWFVLLIVIYFSKYKNLGMLLGSMFTFVFGLFPALGFLIFYTGKFYRSFANQGYVEQIDVGWKSQVVNGFFGLWVSPSKGILVYSPVFLFIFVSIFFLVRKIKNRNFSGMDYQYVAFISIVFMHTIVLGKWKHWYGGWSFGYRMASDVMPYMVLALIPFLTSTAKEKFRKPFYLLVCVSFAVQLMGLVFFDGIWHAAYDKGYSDTSWLWSIRDSEAAFNIRRMLVKIGYLERACEVCEPSVFE